jgi:hypothetical protein
MLPSCKCAILTCARILLCLLAFSVLSGLASAQTDNWTGTTGNWSDGTQWDNGIPVAGENIVIGTVSANSTDDFSLAIGNLTLSNSADSLTIADGVALNVSGTIANQGSIALASAGSNTYLQITGAVSLSGSGKLTLGSAGPNYVVGASGSGTETLTSINTIQGAGNIGNGLMGFVNNGIVNANTSAANLFINVSSAGFTNTGTLQASTGGNLTIQGPANSFFNYNGTTNTLSGGTYTANGGNIYFTGSASGITVLSARVTQEASGQIINTTTGTNAFSNLATITSTGVLTTTAGFTQPGAFSMAGALNILPSTVINVGSVKQIISGALTGGQWVLDSSLNITGTAAHIVTNSATMTLSGGTFKNTADGSDAFASLQTNKKTLRVLNFAHFNINGSLTNIGQMTVAKGCTLAIGGTGTSYAQTTGKTTMDGMLKGAVNITGGSYLGAGAVTGNFSLGGGTSNATFSVGDAGKAAQVKITGTYSQLTNGILTTPIGGTTVATQYSQVKPSLAATLSGGTLTAPLILAFTPTVGQTFTVLSAKSLTGTFSNSTIAINSSEHFAISYTATSVVLTVTSGPAAE